MTSAVVTLASIAADPSQPGRVAAQSGMPVVGIVGSDVPAALVRAAGAFAVTLAGGARDEGALREADELLGAVDDRDRGILASVLAGQQDHLRGILLSSDSPGALRMFSVLRQLRAGGRLLPDVHLIDSTRFDRAASHRFMALQLVAAAEVLGGWTGRAVTGATLRDAVVESRRVIVGLRHLSDRRVESSDPHWGVALARATIVAQSVEPVRATALIEQAMQEPEAAAAAGARPALRLFVTGSTPADDALPLALAELGVAIVGEDHEAGAPLRARLPEIPGTLDREEGIASLVAMLGARPRASSRAAPVERGAATRDGVRSSRAQGLLCLVRAHDGGPAWDYPDQRSAVGVPARMLRPPTVALDVDALKRAIDELRQEGLR